MLYMAKEIQFILYNIPNEDGKVQAVVKDETIWLTQKAISAFIIGGGAAGNIGYSEVDFWAADDCLCIYGNKYLDSRYLYHLLLMNQDYFISKVRRASIPLLNRKVIIL